MAALRRLVVDVLKPHEPLLTRFADRIAEVECVDGVCASLVELDKEVQNVELTVEGGDLDIDAIEDVIDSQGGTVHSIDQAACGERVVEDGRMMRDG